MSSLSGWFGLVVWGFEPLSGRGCMGNRPRATPNHRDPSHQLLGEADLGMTFTDI